MRRTQLIFVAIVLVGSTCGAYFAMADAESDPLAKAPAPVQTAARKLIGQNKLVRITKETYYFKTIYDVELTINGMHYDADMDSSGNILAREVDIDASMVPPAVLNAAKKAHPKGTIGETEIVTQGDKMFYGVGVKVGSETRAMEINADGTVTDDSIATAETPL